MPQPVIRTQRIELRPLRPQHLPLLHELDSDPEVMRYLLGRARTPDEIDEFWGPRCADTRPDALGLGWWAGFDGDDFLGWWELSPSVSGPEREPSSEDAEIGWRVIRCRWRQGLASEGARALLAYGFGTLGLERVWAETMTVNEASRGVMRAVGMRHVRTEYRAHDEPLPGSEDGEVVYEIAADEWRAAVADGSPAKEERSRP